MYTLRASVDLPIEQALPLTTYPIDCHCAAVTHMVVTQRRPIAAITYDSVYLDDSAD